MINVDCDHGRSLAFDPRHTALLMIDMQREFVDERGVSGSSGEDVSPVRAILPTCKSVLEAARRMGLFVVYTREGHEPDLSDLHPAKRERSAAAGGEIGAAGPLGRFLIRGEYGHGIIDELRPIDGEPVLDKSGFGAFYNTDLGNRLKIRGITHLIIAGVTTQCCVFSTLREAIDRGFYCLTLTNCTAAFDADFHDATFRMIASEGHLFGWTTDSNRLLAASLKTTDHAATRKC